MRALVFLIALTAGCGKNGSTPSKSSVGSSAMDTEPKPGPKSEERALTMDLVTLLHPEPDMKKRVGDVNAFADTVKQAANVVAGYDTTHPGALPAELDIVLVMRAGALRAWLIGPNGDLPVPEIESAIAALTKVPMNEGSVGVVIKMVRPGTPSTQSRRVPDSWKAAASNERTSIDEIINKVWPPS